MGKLLFSFERKRESAPQPTIPTQNASERVGGVCLKYRPKGTFMKDIHYRAATDLGIIHVNAVVIGVVRKHLGARGVIDEKLSAFGSSFEAKLFEMLGLECDTHQTDAWAKVQERRVTQSLYRRSDNYKRKRATQRKQLAAKRKGETKQGKPDYTYKESRSAGSHGKGKGMPGACRCGANAQCANKACPCVVANWSCTPACHGGRPAPKCKRCIVQEKDEAAVPGSADRQPPASFSPPPHSDPMGDCDCSDPESEVLSELSCVEELE